MSGIEHAYASMVALGTGLDSGWPMRYISEAVVWTWCMRVWCLFLS